MSFKLWAYHVHIFSKEELSQYGRRIVSLVSIGPNKKICWSVNMSKAAESKQVKQKVSRTVIPLPTTRQMIFSMVGFSKIRVFILVGFVPGIVRHLRASSSGPSSTFKERKKGKIKRTRKVKIIFLSPTAASLPPVFGILNVALKV